MDIDLLSKMVKELILDNDKVVLPGLGSFVAEIVPSAFSDKGYTINPPYRKLYFRAKPDEGSALAEFYASSNKVNIDIANKVITDFVAELKSVLFARKTVVFPGLGRLRATKENAVFFVADEDLDIYPEGFALEPISLKTHVETPAEVAAVVGSLKAIVEEPVQEVAEETPQVETVEAEPAPVVETEPVSEQSDEEAGGLKAEAEPVQEPDPVVEEAADVAEQTVEEETVESKEDVTEEPVTEEPVAEEPVAEVKEQEPVAVQRKKPGFLKIFAKTLMWLVLAAVVLLAAYMVVARFAPEVLDQILYTPEELEIINR